MSLTQQKLAERAAAKAQPRRRRLPELGQVLPIPDWALGLVPPQVKQASAEFNAALAKLSAARAKVTEAKQGVVDAQWADEAAARKAAKNGGKAPKRTAPTARRAVADAEAMVPAVEFGAREAQQAYLAAVNTHRDEIAEAAESRLRTVKGELGSLCDQLETALLRRDSLVQLIDEVTKPIGGCHPIFQPRTRSRLGARRTEALAELRAGANGQ